MRKTWLFLCGAAALAAAGPAWAQGETKISAATPPGMAHDTENVPNVNPGDQIGIACSPLDESTANSDVRVVLTISAAPGETPGYDKVLATDEEVGNGAVRVRIPTVPDIEDHLIDINVYVMNDGNAQTCDAGHMKVVRRQPGKPGSVG